MGTGFEVWPPASLPWAFVGSGGLGAALTSDGPSCCESCPWQSRLLESTLHLCSVPRIPLPDHLSPLAAGSGDACGFNIMHRCDLGEGRHGCGLTHMSWGHWTLT